MQQQKLNQIHYPIYNEDLNRYGHRHYYLYVPVTMQGLL